MKITKLVLPPMELIPYQEWKNLESEKGITVYSNSIARGSSIEEAVIVRRFIYLWERFKKQSAGDCIFIQPFSFCNPIGLSEYAFRKTIRKWEDYGLLVTKCMGAPLKKFYSLNEEAFAKYLSGVHRLGCKKGVEVKTLGSSNLPDSISYLDESGKLTPRIRQDNLTQSAKICNTSIGEENNTPAPLARLGEGGFFASSIYVEERHVVWARKFYAVLAEKRLISSSSKPKQWAKDFQKLERDLKKLEVSGSFQEPFLVAERIKKTLRWYIENIDAPYMPQAYSPKTFGEKLVAIERRMLRATNEKALVSGEAVTADQLKGAAKMIYEEIKPTRVWPKGSAVQLPGVIVASVRNYQAALKAFVSARRWLRAQPHKDGEGWETHHGHLWDFFNHVDSGAELLGETEVQIVRHFARVSMRVAKWADWSGNLTPEIWSLDNKQWNQLGREVTQRYSETNYWDEFIALLKKHAN